MKAKQISVLFILVIVSLSSIPLFHHTNDTNHIRLNVFNRNSKDKLFKKESPRSNNSTDNFKGDIDDDVLVSLAHGHGLDWSHNGEYFVLASYSSGPLNMSGDYDIFLVSNDGSEVNLLTETPNYEDSPRWSPNGEHIYFYSPQNNNPSIWRMNSNGTNRTLIIENGRFSSISSTGTKIVYSFDGDVWVMDLKTKDKYLLANRYTSAFDGGYLRDFDWSPNDDKILLSDGNIWIIDQDGTNLTKITNFSMGCGHGRWSPDGNEIVYDVSNDGVYLMNSDGTNNTKLLPKGCCFPDFSPDGTKIAYESNGIYIHNLLNVTGFPTDKDLDGDGWNNSIEEEVGTDPYDIYSFPSDLDSDRIPDIFDYDIDGDEWNNSIEEEAETDPFNASENPTDTDNDSIFDYLDFDIDGDGWNNSLEQKVDTDPFNNLSYPSDLDNDGIPDSIDPDRDGDNVLNVDDAYPDDPYPWEGDQNNKENEGDSSIYIITGIIVLAFLIAIVTIFLIYLRKQKPQDQPKEEFGRVGKEEESVKDGEDGGGVG